MISRHTGSLEQHIRAELARHFRTHPAFSLLAEPHEQIEGLLQELNELDSGIAGPRQK